MMHRTMHDAWTLDQFLNKNVSHFHWIFQPLSSGIPDWKNSPHHCPRLASMICQWFNDMSHVIQKITPCSQILWLHACLHETSWSILRQSIPKTVNYDVVDQLTWKNADSSFGPRSIVSLKVTILKYLGNLRSIFSLELTILLLK